MDEHNKKNDDKPKKNSGNVSDEKQTKKDIESMAPHVDERIKYYILAIAAVLVVLVVFIVVNEAKNETDPAPVTATEEAKPVPMQLVYIVTKEDDNYDEYMAMVDELEREYGDRIIFDIKDIDDDPEVRDNFPVDAFGTPLLIIVNDEGGFTAIEGKCDDKAKIQGYIKKTLENRRFPDATFSIPSGESEKKEN